MDAQLQEIIDKIKTEGVESAEQKAAELIAQAEQKSHGIIEDAKAKAVDIVTRAETEVEQLKQAGNQALTQASRDLLLQLQNVITNLLNEVIKEEAGAGLKGSVLENAIIKLAESWPSKEIKDLSIILSEADLQAIEKGLRRGLAEKIKSGVVLKPSAAMESGFRVSVQDGNAYFNFTSEEIAAALSQYLNPRLSEIMKKAVE